MRRYYFDIHDGQFHRDSEGIECEDFDAVRTQVMNSLPEIARWSIPGNGESQAFGVLVSDDAGAVVYSATLTFAGMRLA